MTNAVKGTMPKWVGLVVVAGGVLSIILPWLANEFSPVPEAALFGFGFLGVVFVLTGVVSLVS